MRVVGGEEMFTKQELTRDLAGKMHAPKHENYPFAVGFIIDQPLLP